MADQNAMVACLFLVLSKGAAKGRVDAEHMKEIPGNGDAGDYAGAAVRIRGGIDFVVRG